MLFVYLFPISYAIIAVGGGIRPLCRVSKGAVMNNILFFLMPKAMCAYVYDDFTIRQALEKMEAAGFAALPILNKRGELFAPWCCR